MKRRILLILLSAAIVLVPMATPAWSTPPFGNALIVKKQGTWKYPNMFTSDLAVVDLDRNTRHRLPLKQLFPGKDYDLHVSWTTAGPLWGRNSLYYVVRIEGVDYFTMHTWAGKRLLIDLDRGRIADPAPYADVLQAADEKEILATLAAARESLAGGKGFDEEKLQAAAIFAAQYRMQGARADLEAIEKEGDWHGPMDWYSNYLSARALKLEADSEFFHLLTDRRIAQLALRRLGVRPAGYPAVVFDHHRKGKPLGPDRKAQQVERLRAGMTSQAVYELLGPPDYMARAVPEDDVTPREPGKATWEDGWRYDIDAQPDYSLLIVWNEAAKIDRIEKVIPALWHGDELFSDKATKPIFGPDGSFNAVHLYTPAFMGKIELLAESKPRSQSKSKD